MSFRAENEKVPQEGYSLVSPTGKNSTKPNSAADGDATLADLKSKIRGWHVVPGFPKELAQFETVFWEPDDTTSLRQWLANSPRVQGGRILEVGTGTGLIALWCKLHGASSVIATDANAEAIANAKYNAMHLGIDSGLDVRFAAPKGGQMPGPFEVVDAGQQFDLVISNPPWEDAPIFEDAAMALYDPGFRLLDGFLNETKDYLSPDGKLLLAYGAKTAIERIQSHAPALGWTVAVEDQRNLQDLPEVFLPAMLLVLERSASNVGDGDENPELPKDIVAAPR